MSIKEGVEVEDKNNELLKWTRLSIFKVFDGGAKVFCG